MTLYLSIVSGTLLSLWLLYLYSSGREWKTELTVGQIWEFPGKKLCMEITRLTPTDVTFMRWNGPYMMGRETWTISGFRQFAKDRKLNVLP